MRRVGTGAALEPRSRALGIRTLVPPLGAEAKTRMAIGSAVRGRGGCGREKSEPTGNLLFRRTNNALCFYVAAREMRREAAVFKVSRSDYALARASIRAQVEYQDPHHLSETLRSFATQPGRANASRSGHPAQLADLGRQVSSPAVRYRTCGERARQSRTQLNMYVAVVRDGGRGRAASPTSGGGKCLENSPP